MGGLPVKNKPPSVSASPATRPLRREAATGHPPETPCHLGCKQRAPASSVQPTSSASEGPVCHRKQTTSRHRRADRKSTRLNSSHSQISYAVFCLKKKTKTKLQSPL